MNEQVSPAQQPEQTVAPNPELRFEMSAGIGKLIEALAKARKAFQPIIKSEVNPFFKSKYADLAAVIEATKDGLSDNGMAVLQPPVFERSTGTVEIITLLAHSSGQWIKSILHMPVSKTDAQGVGSAITYGRRYSYSALLNVASEQDDDGNAAVSGDFKKGKKEVKEESELEFDQRTEGQQCISPFQITAIDEACKRTGKTEAEVSSYLGLIGHKRIEHILKSEFQEFLKWANGIKKAELKKASQLADPKVDHRTKAMRRLWATAAELGMPEEDVKQASYERFKVDSMSKLDEGQLDTISDWIKSVAAQG